MKFACNHIRVSSRRSDQSRFLALPTNSRKIASHESYSLSRARLSAIACALAALFVLSASVARAIPAVIFNGVVSTVNTGAFPLDHPQGAALDLAGNLYISDTLNDRILEIAPSGTGIVLLLSGLSPALNTPSGLAVDSSGNLYIADTGNNRIVEVTPAGSASVVSTGSATLVAPVGIAIDSSGNIFVSNISANNIVEIPSTGSASVLNITGLISPLSSPYGVAVDTFGNLYIADNGNDRVVEVNTSGAGSVVNTNAALTSPHGVAITRNGVLYITDSAGKVVLVDSQGNVTLLLNGNPTLTHPFAIAVSPTGTAYVTDTGTGLVDSLQSTSVNFGHVTLLSSSTVSLSFSIGGGFSFTNVAAYTSGIANLDFTLANSSTCMPTFTNGTCSVDVTFSPTAPGLRPGAIVVTFSDGTNSHSLTVPVFGFADAPVASLTPAVATTIDTGSTTIQRPSQAVVDAAGNIYVATFTSTGAIYKIPAGGGSATAVSTGSITLSDPVSLAIDASGNLFVSDYGNDRIVEIPANGTALLYSITGLTVGISQPWGLTFDGSGNLYIQDFGSGRIIEVNPAGQGTVLSTGSYAMTPQDVSGIAVDAAGNIFIPDYQLDKVTKVDPFGHATQLPLNGIGSVYGSGILNGPFADAVDANGNLYVLDSNNQRIIQVTTSGATRVLPFIGATLEPYAFGITTDAGGNLIVADSDNNRLVKINMSAAALPFADTTVGSTSSDSPQAAIVTNLGDQPLAVAATAGYTANFPQNTSDSNSCTVVPSLQPGTSCDVSLSFTPQSIGSLTATINVSDNSRNLLGVLQQISASGNGIGKLPTIVWTQPSPILSGTSLSSVLNASASFNRSSLPGTFAYTATAQGGSPVSVTSSTVLAAGNYTLTVTFTPTDATNYQSATANVSLAVQDFAFNVSGSGAVTSQTVSRGGTATFSFTITPGGTTFPAAVTLSATGMPTGATATFTPASIPSGAGATSVTLTIQVPATLAANRITTNFLLATAFAPTLIGLVFLPFSRKARSLVAKNGRIGLLFLLIAFAGIAAGLAGCGSSTPPASNNTTTSPQSYNVVVTATSGSSSHSTTLTLTVQ